MKRDEPRSIGGALQALRERADMRQQDVAEALGVSRGQVSKWELDVANPTWATITGYLDVVGATVRTLADALEYEHPDAKAQRALDIVERLERRFADLERRLSD